MIHKTYLSRAQTRAMAIDHPIGDPTGGAAYREMRAPVVAIVGMAGSVAAAGGFAAMTLMQGLAFAGSALGLVGSITGNKTLSRIGMVAGLAGGIGALAEGAFGFSTGTLGETFGAGAEAAGAAASSSAAPLAASQAPGRLTPVVDGAQTFAIPEPRVIEAMPLGAVGSGSSSPASLAAGAGRAATGASGPASINTPVSTAASSGSLASSPLNTTLRVPGTSALDGVRAADSVDLGVRMGADGISRDPTLWEKISDAGGGLMNMLKENPETAKMLASAGEGVADWLSGRTEAELDALQAQIGYADARAMQIQEEIENEKRRRKNLNDGYRQVNQTVQVNPNASIPAPWDQQGQMAQYVPQPQNPGLIQGQMVPRMA